MATRTFSVSEFFYDNSFKDYAVVSALYIDIAQRSVGLNFLNPVRLLAVTNVEPVGSQIVDGVHVNESDRVLLTNQYSTSNGIYVVQNAEWQNVNSIVGDVVVSLEGFNSGNVFIKINDYRWSQIVSPLQITPTTWTVIGGNHNG